MNGETVPAALAVCGGTVITPAGAELADVRIDGDVISAIDPVTELATEPATARHPGRRVIDADGCIVLPGAVDAHAHVGLPYVRLDRTVVWSADRFPEASKAAAVGGTTTIIDFVMQSPGEDLLAPLSERLAFIQASTVDVALHCWIMDASDRVLGQVPELVARGVPSFKAFMAYSQLGSPMSDGELFALFEAVAAAEGLLALHAENASLNARRIAAAVREGRAGFEHFAATRPAVGEEEAVSRALIFAGATGAQAYFVHVSTAAAVQRIADARARGQRAWVETCPHFLLFDEHQYEGERAGDFLMAPPLRTESDQRALWKAIVSGGVDVVATDHSAWPRAVKNYGDGFPGSIQGVAGLGLQLPLLAAATHVRDDFDWTTIARVTAEHPARIFGLYPRKGVIRAGSDADLVIVDPDAIEPVAPIPPHWAVDNCIYSGLPAIYPKLVLRRGEELSRSGTYVGSPTGTGEFIPGALDY